MTSDMDRRASLKGSLKGRDYIPSHSFEDFEKGMLITAYGGSVPTL
jgi:hypothetical protein